LQQFIDKFNATTAAVQGSGWGWLGYNTSTKKLEIKTTANQDFLNGLAPLLTVGK
jgi:Fe-Mn family superoxide dismutase